MKKDSVLKAQRSAQREERKRYTAATTAPIPTAVPDEPAGGERDAFGLARDVRRAEKLLRDLERRLALLDDHTRKAAEIARRLQTAAPDTHAARWYDLENLYTLVARHASPVRHPLVLISQVSRSGGTLLSQLFDGHPRLYAHPHELYIGSPGKEHWPHFDLTADPEAWWQLLRELPAETHARAGYTKGTEERLPFLFLPSLQRELFFLDLAGRGEVNSRAILDAYFTAYFHAWLDYHNRAGDKRAITAFVPQLALIEESVAGYFDAYPDGLLISLVREPDSWLVSKQSWLEIRQHVAAAQADALLGEWEESAAAALRNRERYGESVVLLRYEDLVRSTERVMRHLCGRIGIKFDPCLLRPSFNGTPIAPNSALARSEGAVSGAIAESPIARGAGLDPATRALVERRTEVLRSALAPHLLTVPTD